MKTNKRRVLSLWLIGLLLVIGLLTGCKKSQAPNYPEVIPPDPTKTNVVTSEAPTEAPTPAATQKTTEAETKQPVETVTQAPTEAVTEAPTEAPTEAGLQKDGTYTSKEEVALYLHTYGELPSNYITKKEAENLGWNSSKGNLKKVAPGKSIGGDRFGNYEGLLPKKKGRQYYECDIDFDGGYRNAKRIIFSNDGLIYYTEDHYKSFEQLYGEA